MPYKPSIGPKEDLVCCQSKPRVRVTKEVARLDVSAIFQIFHYILPFFKSLEFKSRKRVDFIYWEVAVKLRALGYLNNSQGLEFIDDICSYINNKRYSTDLNETPKAPDFNRAAGGGGAPL